MAPMNPTTEFATQYRVIAMDQRNAGGQSRAPITAQDGWDSYTADHIALLDHLRIDRCHLYGQCIGGSFILNLIKAQPRPHCVRGAGAADRARRRSGHGTLAAVRRVGGVAQGPSRRRPRQVLDAFYHNLYGRGFVYCVDRAFVSTVRTPCLVLAGNDEAHPYPIAEELVETAAELRIHP